MALNVTWREVGQTIPWTFRRRADLIPPVPPGNHNGASSPFRSIYPLIYSRRTREDIDTASYVHDWGYMFARLPGAPYSFLSRLAWDRIYRDYLRDLGHPIVAAIHYAGVRLGGNTAWERNADLMTEWGYFSYFDYMDGDSFPS